MQSHFIAHLKSRIPLSCDIFELRLELEDPSQFDFRPGQFINIHFQNASGASRVTSYSIASRRNDVGLVRLVVRTNSNNDGIRFLSGLAPGAPIVVSGPSGSLVLDPAHEGDAVFCVTGTGASPLIPMLEELASRAKEMRRLVFWGVRYASDLDAYSEIPELCDAACAELAIYVSRPANAWFGNRGRITSAVLDSISQLNRPTFYLAGNVTMVRQLRDELACHGVERSRRIRHEAYVDAV